VEALIELQALRLPGAVELCETSGGDVHGALYGALHGALYGALHGAPHGALHGAL